jgi:mRNA interferase MazF
MVAFPRRGEIYETNFNPARVSEQAGIRPALVVQNDIGNSSSSTTIVAGVTSKPPKKPYPFEVCLPDGTLPKPSWVKCDQLLTVAKDRLGRLMGVLSSDVMSAVDDALTHSLGIRR